MPFLLEKSKTHLQFDQTIFGVPCLRKTMTKPLTLPNASCINSPDLFVVWSTQKHYIQERRVKLLVEIPKKLTVGKFMGSA